RGTARSAPGDGRHAHRRDRFPDHGAISAAHAEACESRRVRAPAGVRRLWRDRPGQGLPAGRLESANPVELSRGGGFRADEGRARSEAGETARLMPGIRETRSLPYSAEQMFDLVAD